MLFLFYYYFRNAFNFKKFKTKKENKLLFVYGTLKRGFHWHGIIISNVVGFLIFLNFFLFSAKRQILV